jgi:hypothetical protein
MQEHTTIPFPHPQLTAAAPLTEVLRQGAQRLLAQAIEAEIAMLFVQYADRHYPQGSQAIVRNGSLPEREVHTGIGAVRVKVPRVRDRSDLGIRFHSALLPPYIRQSKSLDALLPWLYSQASRPVNRPLTSYEPSSFWRLPQGPAIQRPPNSPVVALVIRWLNLSSASTAKACRPLSYTPAVAPSPSRGCERGHAS